MNISFEDLADASLPEEVPEPLLFVWLKHLLRITAVLCIGGFAVAFYYHRPQEATLPVAATRLLVVEGDIPEGVLPHDLDTATEFGDSFDHLKHGFQAPEYRETFTPEQGKVVSTLMHEASDTAEFEWVDGPDANVTAAPVSEVIELPADAAVELQIQRDWEGIVLVPNNVKLSRAYTSEVRLSRVEAHPIDGGRLRVWSRIQNLTDRAMRVETACEFRFAESRLVPSKFRPGYIPANGVLDVYFVSNQEGVDSYTLMVKQ